MSAYKNLLVYIILALFLSACSILQSGKQTIYDISNKAESIEVDTDDNGAIDINYGGTNAATAAGARTNLSIYSQTQTDSLLDAKQVDLDVPTEPQAEDRTSTTEYVWTPQRVGQAIYDYMLDIYGHGGPLTAEPANEYILMIVAADSTWDPAGVGQDSIVMCTATGTPGTWIALYGADGTIYGDYPLYVRRGADLNDTSSPHTLTSSEMMNTVITNSDAVGAEEYDAPAYSSGAGWNVTFLCEAAQNMVIDPNGTEQWYLNEAQLSAGENIQNTGCAAGESVTCIGGYSTVYCRSDYFVEETP